MNVTLGRAAVVALSIIALLVPGAAGAQDKAYTEGTVWSVSMIRVRPGMFDVYMNEVLPMRKKMNEETRKQGLLLSSHILSGNSYGRDDFDVLLLIK